MRHSFRSAVLALVAVVALTGCSMQTTAKPLSERVIDAPPGTAQEVAEALTARLDAATMQRVGVDADGDRLTVRYESDSTGVPEEVFTTPGVLTVRPVDGSADGKPGDCADAAPADGCRATTPDGEELRLGASGLSNDDIDQVEAQADQQGGWMVLITLTDAGGDAMGKLSGELACAQDQEQQRFAVLLDGEILTAPVVMLECGDVLSDEIQLSGLADRAEATRTAALLAAELPEGVTVVSTRD